MKRQAAYLSILKDFFRCGIAGWCLEILFTSVEAWMRGDVKIMGTTSVIMFPIYAAGAILPDIVKWCDRWLIVTLVCPILFHEKLTGKKYPLWL